MSLYSSIMRLVIYGRQYDLSYPATERNMHVWTLRCVAEGLGGLFECSRIVCLHRHIDEKLFAQPSGPNPSKPVKCA
jgi:hypothetical protein